MRIEHAEVVVTSPGRNFVTLKVTTSDGVVIRVVTPDKRVTLLHLWQDFVEDETHIGIA